MIALATITTFMQMLGMSVPAHPLDSYMTCVGVSARVELERGTDVAGSARNAEHNCEHLADAAIERMSHDAASGYDRDRYLKDYGLMFAATASENRLRLQRAVDAPSARVAVNIKSGTSKN
ncbi:MAG: hypothetical protein M3R64_06695 [Pseudomonadota bacterium]|nr:hypothetical protein [Pseudomonadota bacterium]